MPLLNALPSRWLTRLLESCRHERRMALLRALGVTVGRRSSIHPPFRIANRKPKRLADQLVLGDDVYIGRDCLFDLKDRIVIGNRVTLAYRVCIVTHWDPGASRLAAARPPTQAPVTICDDAYVGTQATLLPGVTLGAACIVAAGAVVTHDVAPGTTVGGVPARAIATPIP